MFPEIQILKHNEIDKNKWDDCIKHSHQSIIYALSWYLDIVSPNWEAIVLIKNDSYDVVMPIPIKKKLGIKFVHQPFFCQQLGVFSRNKLEGDLIKLILNTFLESFFYTPLYSFNSDNNKILSSCSQLKITINYTHHLSLTKNYDQLFRNYKRDRKYRIKQAKKLNNHIISGKNIDQLIQIFQDDTERKIQGGVQEDTYRRLKKLYEEIAKRGLSEIYYIYDNLGKPECGAWFVKYQNKIIYLFNASTKESRDKNGRSLILDHMIKKYQDSNLVLDFESPEKKEIASFYKSFGSETVPFKSIYFNNSPSFIKKLHQLKINLHRKLLSIKG